MSWIHNKTINHIKINERLNKCLETGQFTNNGYNVKDLEFFIRKNFKINDEKSVICVTNATVGLWALTSAIDFNDNINIKWCSQSFTFPSSVQGLLKNTIIVDIDNEGGLNLDMVPDECNGIIVTNVFGNVVDISKYEKWAKDNNKYLIFDNAATAYTFYKGQNSCNYGVGSIISFHHTKPFGFGEGGAIIIDHKYEEAVRRIINFGISNEKQLKWNSFGGNYKMSEISAIYIIQYLEDNMDNIIQHHRNMYEKYKNHYTMYPNFGDIDNTVLSCFCLLDDKFTNEYVNKIIELGIMCRKYYNPLIDTKNAMNIYNKILCYPLNLDINNITLI
jgi:dTDP-4-amino-4,6-dideoxygalactose transaminase